MNKEDIKFLAQKFLNGTATEEEQKQLHDWYSANLDAETEEVVLTSANENYDHIKNRLYSSILEQLNESGQKSGQTRRLKLWPRIAVAAAAVAAITLGTWIYMNEVASVPRNDEIVMNDVAPGKNGATITLSNGKVIALSDKKLGVVVGQDLKYNDGAAVQGGGPDPDKSGQALRQDDDRFNEMQTLTASTARGQTYQFTLPDGTKVWLNADSKLEFPSSFVNSKTRFVKLSGEGYFEVAKNKQKPFIVETDDKEQVEVLGTHFNISSYKDNGTITSLLEGSVKLTNKVEGRILKPGERAIGTVKGIMLVPGDVNDAVAWKNGYFRFRGEQIQPIMEQLARWYDIEVSYQGKMPQDGFNGKVSRNKNISQVLKALEAMKIVHFKVEGRRVTVID